MPFEILINTVAIAIFAGGAFTLLRSLLMDFRLLLSDKASNRNHEYFATFAVVLLTATGFMLLGIGIKVLFA